MSTNKTSAGPAQQGPSVDQSQPDHVDHGKDFVEITVNDRVISMHRGHQTVVAIKQAADVPLAYDLDEIVAGEFVLLPDEGAVVLKGGEKFLAHPKDGGSS